MGDISTAMRDPVFYRWHKFIDSIFQQFKATLQPYTSSQVIYKMTNRINHYCLKYLSDKDELYSEYGIRSLSKSDLLYHTGDDYWRGNIWMNTICLSILDMSI